MTPKEYILNAEGKKLGRLASEAAKLLIGKGTPDFVRNQTALVKVKVENAGKLAIDERRLTAVTHQRYSGYPGGRRVETGKAVAQKKGMSELVRHAVWGMLPKNKLRSRMFKNLIVTE